ncbi:MAG TPA: choline transporter, partial [Pseudoxanthomonas mexicana]|nr:choline transporter [Pseudoxanthomonas mexicana]
MILMCWGMVRAMRLDVTKRQVLRSARSAPLALAGADWKGRLRTLVHQPRQAEVKAFLLESVRPALADVAAELQAQGLTASVGGGEDGRVWLEVGHGEEMDFFYSV